MVKFMLMQIYNSSTNNQGNLKGELAVAAILPSSMEGELLYLWIFVVVVVFFCLLLSPQSNFFSSWGLKLCTHLGYCVVNTWQQWFVQIIPNDRTKFRGTITNPPCMNVKMAAPPVAFTQWSKKDTVLLFKFLACNTFNDVNCYLK